MKTKRPLILRDERPFSIALNIELCIINPSQQSLSTGVTAMEMLLPFAGFYCSIHDAEVDNAHERLAMDNDGITDTALLEHIYKECDWSGVYQAYAKEYAEQLAHKFDIKFEFKFMSSPREYNFTTDRIFVEIELDEAIRLWNNLDHEKMRKIAKEKFTSRSGFISSYSPDWNDWGSFKTWDHNQLGTVLEAYLASQEEEFDELNLMEDAQGNGKLDEWIFANMSAEAMEKYNTMRNALDSEDGE
jgi:hypothetical protein